jgi:DNA-binding MarR family transcriptional regulator
MSSRANKPDNRTEITLLARRLAVELEAFSHGFAVQHALHPTDVRAIVLIMDAARKDRDLRPADLSHQLGLSTASVTALLDRLERDGHIERKRHPTDRRGITIVPHESIMQLGGAYFGGLQWRMVEALVGFDENEVLAARRIMEALVSVIDEGDDARRQVQDRSSDE